MSKILHTHSGDFGDIIYYLSYIRHCKQQGHDNKLMLVQEFAGQREIMTNARKRFISPLIQAQDYVELIEEDFNEAVRLARRTDTSYFSFREVRQHLRDQIAEDVNRKNVSLHDWAFLYRKTICGDLDQPWLNVEVPEKSFLVPQRYIVVSRSARYHNPDFPWYDLNQFASQAIFVGSVEEHEAFCKRCGIGILYAPMSNALELAQLIKGARLFIGNQSLPLAIAEGLKKPVLVEDSAEHPDCYFNRVNHVAFCRDGCTSEHLTEFVNETLYAVQ